MDWQLTILPLFEILVIVKLDHVVLDVFYSYVTVYCRDYFDGSEALHCLHHQHQLERLIIHNQNFELAAPAFVYHHFGAAVFYVLGGIIFRAFLITILY